MTGQQARADSPCRPGARAPYSPLYQSGPEFEGFTAAGAWEDARLGLRYLRLFEEALAWLASSTTGSGVTHRLIPETGLLVVEPTGPLRAEDFNALALVVDPWIEAHGERSPARNGLAAWPLSAGFVVMSPDHRDNPEFHARIVLE
jgi:hypothetical protein